MKQNADISVEWKTSNVAFNFDLHLEISNSIICCIWWKKPPNTGNSHEIKKQTSELVEC